MAMAGAGALVQPLSAAVRHLNRRSKQQNHPLTQSSSADFSTVPSLTNLSDDFQFSDDEKQSKNEKQATGLYDESIFGPVPSDVEVQKAINELQRVMKGVVIEKGGLGQIEELLSQKDLRIVEQKDFRMLLKSVGQKRLLDGYHRMETDPAVKRMIISISSDREVWDAILKNNSIQSLCDVTRRTVLRGPTETCEPELDLASSTVKWIFGITKSKLMVLIESISSLISEMFKLPADPERTKTEFDALLEEVLKSSVVLSVLLMLIIVVTRSNGG